MRKELALPAGPPSGLGRARGFLGVVVVAAAGLLTAACSTAPPPAESSPPPSESVARSLDTAPDRPNIVVVLADDLGYFDVGFTGNPVIQTPNLDRLAAEGVMLRANYAGSPICAPSRAALLTGRYPNRVGVFDHVRIRNDMGLRTGEFTIASVLRDAGYDTYHGGKWHVTPRWTRETARSHGFDTSAYDTSGLAWSQVGTAIRWLETRPSTDPFFMFLAPIEPHHPVEDFSLPAYRAPYETRKSMAAADDIPYQGCLRPAADRAKRSAYFGAVTQLDEAVGRLVDYLDANGLGEDTLVLFTSDNGPEKSVPYAFGSPGPFTGCKAALYEGGIRMPGFVRWPRGVRAGTVSDEPIHSVDWLATFLELSGGELRSDQVSDGVSVLPALAGKPVEREVPLFWMYWAGQSRRAFHEVEGGMQGAVREGDWKLLGQLEPFPKNWSTFEYLRRATFDHYELYDLSQDPAETNDLSEDYPEVVDRLAAQMESLHRSSMADAPRWDLEHFRFAAQRPLFE